MVAKLQTTLPMARQRETDFKALTEQGFVAGHAGQDQTRERIELERDLATQLARLKETDAALAESLQAKASYLAETQRNLSDRKAKATWVTADAVNDEKHGAIFPATLRLENATIDIDGKAVKLAPGMVVTAEVKTGRRRVIEFLLSPISAAVQQSLKER